MFSLITTITLTTLIQVQRGWDRTTQHLPHPLAHDQLHLLRGPPMPSLHPTAMCADATPTKVGSESRPLNTLGCANANPMKGPSAPSLTSPTACADTALTRGCQFPAPSTIIIIILYAITSPKREAFSLHTPNHHHHHCFMSCYHPQEGGIGTQCFTPSLVCALLLPL